jgi:hypothetical protein
MDDQAKTVDDGWDDPDMFKKIARYELTKMLKDEGLGLAEFMDGHRADLLRLCVFELRSEILALCEKPVE